MPHLILKLGRIILFLLINLFNFRIAEVALSYINPTFNEPFLMNRIHLAENEIFKSGLIVHGICSCIALFLCSLLVLFRIEKVNLSIHRILGKIALYLIFFMVVPGGLILAYYASGGKIGKFLFFLLAVYTFSVAFLALKKAKARKINQHKILMTELLCVLCSAIFLRIFILVFAHLGIDVDLGYQLSIVLSWFPIAILFLFLKARSSYNLNGD